ncbi:hypothetical protein [Microcystis aeruginosa]|uniref:hypothetical protein n=1 Tax=Microcystis aeruginosa TaxID=1126 RepID=UPI00287F6A78|nr:hypothetical protein [Microcystis aeruginosa]WNF17046.1 hypothetical protein RKE53_14685 [Microcystis aeruginosa NRERC-214]
MWGFTHFQAVNYLCHYAIGKARIVAKERGYNWETMTEDEREEFIDKIVHEHNIHRIIPSLFYHEYYLKSRIRTIN